MYNAEYNVGWVCPKCGRTYSPTVPSCFSCGQQTVTMESTQIGGPLFDIFNPNLFASRASNKTKKKEKKDDADV